MKERAMRPMPSRPNADLSPITLRIADACRITGIGRSKFYELIKAGEIEVIKVGAITLVPMTSIDALLQRDRPAACDQARPPLAEVMHPFLANAILTASLASTPEAVWRDLSSADEGRRREAEDGIVERMIFALYDRDDGAGVDRSSHLTPSR
ncbi:helix-turn-helix domain-containing protein [uncultured Sphingomonas sp.]|uniref:helix-turn-helix domain-containing protein n=1 Tax=uncultured Sphingomonas sp. TaxID=158754 RepID=UPI0034310159